MKSAETIKGLVICGSRNILTVRINTKEGPAQIECRLKGKVLKGGEDYYNPLAPGDIVLLEHEENSPAGQIIRVEDRKNIFSRFNQKESKPQILAANTDLVLCVCTRASPPFRPRFIDRVLLQAGIARIEAIVICNKTDIVHDNIDADERLEEFAGIGYKVLYVSAKTGEGIDSLRGEIKGKTSVLTGQSGVGKSSLINALQPGLNLKEGSLNAKYDRGVHTTTMPVLIDLPGDTRIIDTPGVRLFIPCGIKSEEVILYMKEFSPLAGKCSFGLSCSHRSEPGCKIMEAVYAGIIHEDRYESYLRICDNIKGIYSDY